jgi:hypothetical protein
MTRVGGEHRGVWPALAAGNGRDQCEADIAKVQEWLGHANIAPMRL